MILNWPFSKTYKVKCKDGSVKTVYRNIDKAIPLFIPGYTTKVSGELNAIEEAKAKFGTEYASKIQGVLFKLDETNQSLMMRFRFAYINYQSDPCKNGETFQRQVDELLLENSQIQNLQMRIRANIDIAKSDVTEPELFLQSITDLGTKLESKTSLDAVTYHNNHGYAVGKFIKEVDNPTEQKIRFKNFKQFYSLIKNCKTLECVETKINDDVSLPGFKERYNVEHQFAEQNTEVDSKLKAELILRGFKYSIEELEKDLGD